MTRYAPLAVAIAAAFLFFTPPASADHDDVSESPPPTISLASESEVDATVLDPVAQAEQEVEDARANLRAAMAGTGSVKKARRALRKALARLEKARENPDKPLPQLKKKNVAPERVERKPTEPDPIPTADSLPPPTEEAQQPEQKIEVVDEGRVVTRKNGQLTIRHDDSARLEKGGARKVVQKSANGTTTTTIERPNGTRVVTVRDEDDEIVKRTRIRPNGRVEILIGEVEPERRRKKFAKTGQAVEIHRQLPELIIPIPQQEYIVESRSASQRELEEALIAPPVERVERSYSLAEIRRSGRLRNKLRRIDIDTVTFEFGSATIPPDQIPRMERIGIALNSVISRRPGEVFLIEGHTDAVGTDLANLTLSDRRAETVAEILAYYFDIPPENMITQGFGEQFLKIPTARAERANRRVTLRRITPLLRSGRR
jgi:outer membrane protein OmpA-like peptidoglycan-associated protein